MTTLTGGRELDAFVAEKVMGCVRVHIGFGGDLFGAPPALIADGSLPADHGRVLLPRFSTDIAGAWQVVERIAATDDVELQERFARALEAQYSRGLHQLSASDAALAICLAALAVVEPTQ